MFAIYPHHPHQKTNKWLDKGFIYGGGRDGGPKRPQPTPTTKQIKKNITNYKNCDLFNIFWCLQRKFLIYYKYMHKHTTNHTQQEI